MLEEVLGQEVALVVLRVLLLLVTVAPLLAQESPTRAAQHHPSVRRTVATWVAVPVVGVPVPGTALAESALETPVAQWVAPVLVEWVPLLLLLGVLTGVSAPQQARWPLALLLFVAFRLLLQTVWLEVSMSGDCQRVGAGVAPLVWPLSCLLVAQLLDVFTPALEHRLVVRQVCAEPHLAVVPLNDDLLPFLVVRPLLVPLLRVLRREEEEPPVEPLHVDRGVRLPPLFAVLPVLQPVGVLELLRAMVLGVRLSLVVPSGRLGVAHSEPPVAQAPEDRPRELPKEGVVAHDAFWLLVRLSSLRFRGHLRSGRGMLSPLPPRLVRWLQLRVHLLPLGP